MPLPYTIEALIDSLPKSFTFGSVSYMVKCRSPMPLLMSQTVSHVLGKETPLLLHTARTWLFQNPKKPVASLQ